VIREIVQIAINGDAQPDLVPDIAEVEVEEHVDAADAFRVRISVSLQSDGSWSYIDDARFSLWNRLSLVVGYPDDHATLVDGFITHVNLSLSNQGGPEAYLEVTGLDRSVAMDLEEKQRAWVNKKDSGIAQEIFSTYGLKAVVQDTQLTWSENTATTLQAESDIRFLQRLAARNGFSCYVQENTGYFRGPNLQDPPQPILALAFGGDTNLGSVHLAISGTPTTSVALRRIDPLSKRGLQKSLDGLPRRKLGARALADLQQGQPSAARLIKQRPTVGDADMEGVLRDAYEEAGSFVSLSGDIDARAYGHVLRAKRLVTIKGMGSTYSGLYYVRQVHHQFTANGYVQTFEAVRNGLGLTGDEDFSTPPALLPVSLGALGPAAAGGSQTLPAESSVTPIVSTTFGGAA